MSDRRRTLVAVNWLAAYEIDVDERAADLGQPATLTVILRDLDTDARSHVFLAVETAEPGDHQREVILRAMAGAFPDARWKTYNAQKQVATFVGRRHMYIAAYEEHEVEPRPPVEQPSLFAA